MLTCREGSVICTVARFVDRVDRPLCCLVLASYCVEVDPALVKSTDEQVQRVDVM